MRIDKVKYTAHYDEFGTLKDVWVGMEGSVDDTEVPENQLDKLKEITEKWYQSRHPQPVGQPPPMYFTGSVIGPRVIETERTSEDARIAELISSIYACTEIEGHDGLKSYGKLATTCKEAQQAFDIMSNKLGAEKETMRRRTNNLDK